MTKWLELKKMSLCLSVCLMGFSQASLASDPPTVLTAEQLRIAQTNEARFKRFVGGLRADLFRGRAQNFSAFNLDLNTFIHFHRSPLPNSANAETFNLASDGNQTIHGVPVWPIQGFVQYYSADIFKIDGRETTLPPMDGIYYLMESPQGHAERLKRWESLKSQFTYQDYIRASGRIIGVVTMDLQNISIDFYQQVPGTNELIRAGVFTGRSTRP